MPHGYAIIVKYSTKRWNIYILFIRMHLKYWLSHSIIQILTFKCRAALETYEKQHNGKVHIMQAVEINGPNTHPVFRYLKTLFDMDDMDNNFAHYFFISPDSDFFELHYGASYSTLKQFVDYHVKNDLGENPKVDMKAEYDRRTPTVRGTKISCRDH